MGVVIVFLDGVGLGEDDPACNPLVATPMPILRALLGGQAMTGRAAPGPLVAPASLRPLDATLGIPGLPQSGTGQATLWSSRNVAEAQGFHSGPYAPPIAREILSHDNLFSAVQDQFGPNSVVFANAYPPRYLNRLARGTARQSVTALAVSLAGLTLRGPDELRAGEAVSAFITNELWESQLGVAGVPAITPQAAGQALGALGHQHRLTVFEFFATDMAGHRRDEALARTALQRVDGLLEGIVATLDRQSDLLLVVSDHGNLEDWSTTDHTLNPVPGLVWGAGAGDVASQLNSLVDVGRAVRWWLTRST